MQIGERNLELLKEMALNPHVRGKELQDSFNLSRRQVDYSITKLNQWLTINQLPEIERTRQGQFIIHPMIQSLVVKQENISIQKNKVPSEKERGILILFMLLAMKESYSLNHFLIELGVSKNTILSDLKYAQEIATKYNSSIRYSRKQGYELHGNEFDLRRLLIEVNVELTAMLDGKDWFLRLSGVTNKKLVQFHDKVEKVEAVLHLQFTDEKVQSMPFILALISLRVKKGKLLKNFLNDYKELTSTKEFDASKLIFDEEQVATVPTEERLFITLKLLSTNLFSATLVEEIIPELKEAIEEMLYVFEKITLIDLRDKNQLLDKILLHMKPAYYRIKYQLTSLTLSANLVSEEFSDLHHLVKRSAEPLRRLLKAEISEEESTYLTMLIGGWLTKQGENLQDKTKAVVVCPNGVSVSKLLTSTLSKLFPEFLFMDSLSVREFKRYPRDFHVVFSPTFVETDKKLFIVEPFLSQEKKRQLRKKVYEQLTGFAPRLIDWDEVLSIISKYGDIQNEPALVRELRDHFNQAEDTVQTIGNEEHLSLQDLLPVQHIEVKARVATFREAIEYAARPLLHSRKITELYVERMIELHDLPNPYAVLGTKIAIPHASPEDGVNERSLSMLKLDYPLKVSEELAIQLVVVIAPDQRGGHLRALQQLDKIAENNRELQMLITAKTNEDIYDLLQDTVGRGEEG